MSDPEAIRKALEPHGYDRSDDGACGVDGCHAEHEEWTIAGPNGYYSDAEDEELAWAAALIHFLNDKAQTGARMADCVSNGFEVLDLFAATYRPGDDVDEWWAKEWLNKHNLDDPRRNTQ